MPRYFSTLSKDDLKRVSSSGGKARAASLSPARRREIGRMGFDALVERRFNGNSGRARAWLQSLGWWGSDQTYVGTFVYKAGQKPLIEDF